MVKITKKGKKAWVTFTVQPENATDVEIIGEWNEWKAEPLKMKKNGDYYITKVLETGKSYQFGYRIDGHWVCDDQSQCVRSPYGSENSLLEL